MAPFSDDTWSHWHYGSRKKSKSVGGDTIFEMYFTQGGEEQRSHNNVDGCNRQK
jgi:hypothetical protein